MDQLNCILSITSLRDTGKAGVRLDTFKSLEAALSDTQPEMVDPVFNLPTGADAVNDPQVHS